MSNFKQTLFYSSALAGSQKTHWAMKHANREQSKEAISRTFNGKQGRTLSDPQHDKPAPPQVEGAKS